MRRLRRSVGSVTAKPRIHDRQLVVEMMLTGHWVDGVFVLKNFFGKSSWKLFEIPGPCPYNRGM